MTDPRRPGIAFVMLCLPLAASCRSTGSERLALDLRGDGASIGAYRQIDDLGGSPERGRFRIVRALGGHRRADSLDLGVGRGRSWETSFDVFIAPGGRFYFVAGTETGTHVLTASSVDAPWSPVEIDAAIPDGPRSALAEIELLGHAWLEGSDLMLLVGTTDLSWLLRAVDGRVLDARSVDRGCSPVTSVYGGPECHVSVTEEGRVDSIRDGGPRWMTSTLECAASECNWAPTGGVGLPVVHEFEATTRWVHQLLRHTGPDQLAFLRLVFGPPHEVRVLSEDAELTVESEVVGAAARPGGGLLVHRQLAFFKRQDQLPINELLAIRGGTIDRSYPLGALDLGYGGGSRRSTVLAYESPDGGAFAVVAAVEENGSARLITVDLDDGSTSERTLNF